METIEKEGYTRTKNNGVEYFQAAPGVWGMKIVFVNVYIIATTEEAGTSWVLVDAGLRGSADKIVAMAEGIFGKGARPSSILLTHGHFDHVGALEELLAMWDVPVYAHYLELPYLKGLSSYPPPDPMVGGGLMSLMSWMYPKSPKDLGKRVRRLGTGDEVPNLPGWKFIHTPGHSPGQVSFFRESDRTLIAGDTFVTTKQESAFSVMTQKRILSGPPKYFTIDWGASKESVAKLAALAPETAATGHGYPMYGEELRSSLGQLLENFENEAVPAYGRYVKEPARTNKNGVQYVPKRVTNPILLASAAIFGLVAALGMVYTVKGGRLFSSTG
ncbi:MBL fold metallo-hydrolase [Pedobacter sp. SYSU D00535]|uniref:MBL fold metallo-hydrolase n=1 Tax=Pedobacter sp. SYSU D00535 TaxID=2810308 RepID=UPI001A97520B|nr:MBL fold metallo-hydrolase [Pedobacter sp. SYSU D00535]